MVLNCGSLHHGCACWARAMWKQWACSSGWREARVGWKEAAWRLWQWRDPLQLLTLYFSTQASLLFTALSSGSMVLYWANLSPHKNRTALVHTEWESVSLLCSCKDGEDKRKEKDVDKEGASVNNRFVQQNREKRRSRQNRCRIKKLEWEKFKRREWTPAPTLR